ncbi:hypothetical protein V6Z12_A03G176000 [Gossypium hirsutum]
MNSRHNLYSTRIQILYPIYYLKAPLDKSLTEAPNPKSSLKSFRLPLAYFGFSQCHRIFKSSHVHVQICKILKAKPEKNLICKPYSMKQEQNLEGNYIGKANTIVLLLSKNQSVRQNF